MYALGDLDGDAAGFVAYLNRSAAGWESRNASAWGLKAVSTSVPATGGIAWTPGSRGSPASAAWPPRGLTVIFSLSPPAGAPAAHAAVDIQIVYELYDGAPLMSKWVIINASAPAAVGVVVTGATIEQLRLNAPAAELLAVTIDIPYSGGVTTTRDPLASNTPTVGALPVVQALYTSGPNVRLGGGALMMPTRTYARGDSGAEASAHFVSFRALLLAHDSLDRERQSLGNRKVYRLLAPWVLECPLFFHATDSSEKGFKATVDQMAATGFEMYIFSFGANFYFESEDAGYRAR